jgi:hypothetical protein
MTSGFSPGDTLDSGKTLCRRVHERYESFVIGCDDPVAHARKDILAEPVLSAHFFEDGMPGYRQLDRDMKIRIFERFLEVLALRARLRPLEGLQILVSREIHHRYVI